MITALGEGKPMITGACLHRRFAVIMSSVPPFAVIMIRGS